MRPLRLVVGRPRRSDFPMRTRRNRGKERRSPLLSYADAPMARPLHRIGKIHESWRKLEKPSAPQDRAGRMHAA